MSRTRRRLNVAYATYERAGCYACHKTKGFENLRKPGPILTKISGKLTQDWVKNWVRDPTAIKNVTWMPKVWYNSNSNSPADQPRNEVGDQRGGRVSVREQRHLHAGGGVAAEGQPAGRRADRAIGRLSRAATSSTRTIAPPSARGGRSASR